MWIFSVYGFFSVVEHRDKAGKVMVRGRVRADLEKLARYLKQSTGRRHPVSTTPAADYRYRLVADKTAVAEILQDLVMDIDYENFKGAVAERTNFNPETLGRHRLSAYHDVWQVMEALQRRAAALEWSDEYKPEEARPGRRNGDRGSGPESAGTGGRAVKRRPSAAAGRPGPARKPAGGLR